jgi:hypothetical protein
LGCITSNPKAAILLDMLTVDAGGSSATLPRRIGHPIFGRSAIKVAAERARTLILVEPHLPQVLLILFLRDRPLPQVDLQDLEPRLTPAVKPSRQAGPI